MIMRIVRTMKCVVNAMGKITNSKLTYKLRLQDSTSKLLFCLNSVCFEIPSSFRTTTTSTTTARTTSKDCKYGGHKCKDDEKCTLDGWEL